jgi:tetratricopeptide (TPR) repeat protein
MGRAGEATLRAKALVELGNGDEMWQREARAARGISLVFGPTPAEDVIAVLQTLVEDTQGASWSMGAHRGIGRMRALQGRLDEAGEHIAIAGAAWEELGNRQQMASTSGLRGIVEHLAGNHAEAARLIRENYDGLIAIGDRSYASTVAVELGNVLLDLPDDEEAWRFGTIARETSSSDDVISQAGGRAVQARVLSRRGDHDAAEALAREAAAIIGQTDYLDQHGEILVHLAQVLHEAGKDHDAVTALREATALYEQKGATFFVERTRRLIDRWAADG